MNVILGSILACWGAGLGAEIPRGTAGPDSTFAATIAQLSEPGGFFFSDNLVSNETSYLHVMGKLAQLGTRGGAYIGVGPEQNFSYIARTNPAVAIIIDIRRDNQLLHLFFKAVFERSDTRLEYLCNLYGRPCPRRSASWRDSSLISLIQYIDTVAIDTADQGRNEQLLLDRAADYGVAMSGDDRGTVRRLHAEFLERGLDLRFSSYGRRSMAAFPTTRDLYLATDLAGTPASFLASHTAYAVVRDLERRNRLYPIVGDLGGTTALRAVGAWLAKNEERVSLFYLSNVEYYLLRSGTFGHFLDNLDALPLDEQSLLTRSYFGVQTGMPHPAQRPGHLSVQLLQLAKPFVSRARQTGLMDYWRLMTEGMLELPTSPP